MSDIDVSVELDEPAAEERPAGRVLDRTLLVVITVAVTTCAVALLVTAWAALRAADAQRRTVCYTAASYEFFEVNPNYPDPGAAARQRQQDQLREELEACGSRFPREE